MKQFPSTDCSGLLGRTSLRPRKVERLFSECRTLFRPSRPDFIETVESTIIEDKLYVLFRPSRPDFIETLRIICAQSFLYHCSGLLGRTSLRREAAGVSMAVAADCSGLLGRTSLRQDRADEEFHRSDGLFRPSRPDFIETTMPPFGGQKPIQNCSGLLGRTSLRLIVPERVPHSIFIVPAFSAGLH